MSENGEVSTTTSGLNPATQSLIGEGRIAGFSVKLENFDGPFDLLLQLISRHKMEITDVALATVTDEFIAHIRALEETEDGWKLDQATEFLVVAATLLDLKAARLLPSGEVDDEEDLALLKPEICYLPDYFNTEPSRRLPALLLNVLIFRRSRSQEASP